ncbi:MAG TPA: phosphatase PAP2 family protein [Pseudolabrys sp.]|jgi:undecaprenyl-diphosphatase|nr:phosphatase PAP2 family protein [Pseudolabrys sp.]
MSDARDVDRERPWLVTLRRIAAGIIDAVAALARPSRLYPREPWGLTPQRFAIAAGLAVVLIVLVMIVADADAINAVQRLPGAVIWPFGQITDFGKSGWFLWPLGVLFLILAALPASTRMAQRVLATIMVRVGFLLLAIGVPGLLVTIVKRMIGRARPLVTGVVDPFVYVPFKWASAYASLPSGHATTAFSVLVAFGALWPRARPALWVYALAIVVSRVVLTAHFPSDVLAGAIAGSIGALMVRRYFALRRLGFSVLPDGTVRAYPGPSFKRIKAVARALLS